jgi:hypothetical protein
MPFVRLLLADNQPMIDIIVFRGEVGKASEAIPSKGAISATETHSFFLRFVRSLGFERRLLRM